MSLPIPVVESVGLPGPADVLRPTADAARSRREAQAVFDALQREGEAALRAFAARWDGWSGGPLEVSPERLRERAARVAPELAAAIREAAAGIAAAHAAQVRPDASFARQGVHLRRVWRPIDAVGCYAPGGATPLLSSVLMTGIPARLAGCPERLLCTGPGADGWPDPAMCLAALEAGFTRVYRVGGMQAIAAMALGVGMPRVFKLFGPGGARVDAAKGLAAECGVARDLPAGPSELLLVGDGACPPEWAAADLLAQAEHGPDSQALALSTDAGWLAAVATALRAQASGLPRREVLARSLRHARLLRVADRDTALAWINAYAPEHLALAVDDPETWLAGVRNAGSVFLGPRTPEAAGDYATGGNHCLPTGGAAAAWSGLSVADYGRWMGVQSVDAQGLARLAPVVQRLARAEGLEGHARSMALRAPDGPQPASGREPVALADLPAFPRRVRDLVQDVPEHPVGKGLSAEGRLHANEAPGADGINRYPDPSARDLTAALAATYGVPHERVFPAAGSDAAIDALLRATCDPGRDAVAVLEPGFGQYARAAAVQGLTVRRIAREEDGGLDEGTLLARLDASVRILFLADPDNPTGAALDDARLRRLLDGFAGWLVLDEAYAEYAGRDRVAWLDRYPRLVLLRTLSKAWGGAGLRVGCALGHPELVRMLDRVRLPYPLAGPSVDAALELLARPDAVRARVARNRRDRERLARDLAGLPGVRRVWPSAGNFLLVEWDRPGQADRAADRALATGLHLRRFPVHPRLAACLRITVGDPITFSPLLDALRGTGAAQTLLPAP